MLQVTFDGELGRLVAADTGESDEKDDYRARQLGHAASLVTNLTSRYNRRDGALERKAGALNWRRAER